MSLVVQLYRRTVTTGTDGETISPISKDSALHPGHAFKVGEFPISYNPDSFDKVMEHLVGETVYTLVGFGSMIMSNPFKEDIDWQQVKQKISETRTKLQSYKEDTGGYHRVAAIFNDTPNEITRPEHALKLFRQEMSAFRKTGKNEVDLGNFTSEQGDFMLAKPWKVLAAIAGTLYSPDRKCVYVVYEEDLTWYVEALDVIEETADFVLSQPDKNSYLLGWKEN